MSETVELFLQKDRQTDTHHFVWEFVCWSAEVEEATLCSEWQYD